MIYKRADASRMVDTETMYLTTEWFGSEGWMEHNAKVAYRNEQRVVEIVDNLCQTMWLPSELAYGVIIAQDQVPDDEFPQHAPTGLKWVGRSLREDITMEELFAGVEKKENERYFLVISKLDVKTKHIGEQEYQKDMRENVEKAVHWLKDLYLVNNMLRQLKRWGDS